MQVETVKYLGMYVTKITHKTAPSLIEKINQGAKSIDVVKKFKTHNLLSCYWIKNVEDKTILIKNIEKQAKEGGVDTFVRINLQD